MIRTKILRTLTAAGLGPASCQRTLSRHATTRKTIQQLFSTLVATWNAHDMKGTALSLRQMRILVNAKWLVVAGPRRN